MKMTTAEKVLATGALLLVVFLAILPILFHDPVRDWKVYFSPEREKEFGNLTKRLLERGEEIVVDPSDDRSRKFDFSANLNSNMQAELSGFLTSNKLELLWVNPDNRLVELGSCATRTWAIYSYSENGPPTNRPFKSVEAIAPNWYYCVW
ncbi:hypothetical protein GC207_09825 [bacterium]|nr:hypothetical protein [bacterium]